MNIDEIRRRCPNTLIVYRHYSDHDYHESADLFFDEMRDTFNKLRGRGILWEGINEPIVQSRQTSCALTLGRSGFNWADGKQALVIVRFSNEDEQSRTPGD